MTTKELYRKHKAGEVSNQKFLYEVRRDSNLPWINNLTSYEDAVKILKNKSIINEADEKKYGDVEVISKTIDMVNPYEYSKGMNYELDMADNPVRQDLTQDEVLAAQKIVLKNITKDSNYYTKLYAGLKPTTEIEGYKEIDIAGKNLEKGIKADMNGRKADGYIKKELKKDAKANVKDNLGDSEKAPKKPKGVEEFKDKGVTGSFKTIKEGIEEIIREKLAKKKADEAKIEEAQIKVGDIVIPNKGEHKGQKHKVIHVFDDGSMNIQPIGLKAKNIKYRQGAIKAKPEDIELADNYNTGFRPGVDLGTSFEKFKSSLKEKLKADIKEKKNKSLEEGALDDQIAAAEKTVAQKKKELADAEKKVADIKAKEASAEAQG